MKDNCPNKKISIGSILSSRLNPNTQSLWHKYPYLH